MTASGATNDNKWQRMTMSDKRVTTGYITSDREWQRMTTSGTTNENEWKRMKASKKNDFRFRMKQYMQCITILYSAI